MFFLGLHFCVGMLHFCQITPAFFEQFWMVYIFRCSISIHRSLAFGHSHWVHEWGLFSVNTAGVWHLCGWYRPTWKPQRRIYTPMYAGACVLQRKGRLASHVKVCAFESEHVCVCRVGVCLCEWCCGAAVWSEGDVLELNLRRPAASRWVGACAWEGTHS